MNKAERVLDIYTKLLNGKIVNKEYEARKYQVDSRTIQRDVSDIQCSLRNQNIHTGEIQEIIYDRQKRGYRLNRTGNLKSAEVLAVCKVMLESRSLVKEELEPIIEKLLVDCETKEEEKQVRKLIRNERANYQELHHRKKLLNSLWELETAVAKQRYTIIWYEKLQDKSIVKRKVKPVGLMFSGFYFYLTAFIEDIDRRAEFQNPDDSFPTIYRLDRICDFEVQKDQFYILDRDRFQEGEFRKRVQFMYGGKLQKVRFLFTGLSVEAVLDRLPTAMIKQVTEEGYVIEAEVFGKGIEMWFRSQGDDIKHIKYL